MRVPKGNQWFQHKAGLPDYWCNGDVTPTIATEQQCLFDITGLLQNKLPRFVDFRVHPFAVPLCKCQAIAL